jgi:phosphatidylinositol alpha-1,6-mannosyltransferase
MTAGHRHKHILILTDEYPPIGGGVGQWAYGIAHALSAQGHGVEVLTREREDGPSGDPGPASDVPVIRIRGRDWKRYRSWYWHRGMRKHVGSGRIPDLIIATTWPRARSALPVARRARIPMAVVVHGLDITRRMSFLERLGLRYTLGRCFRIVAVSEFTRDRLGAMLPDLEDRILVVPNGVDPTRFSPGPRDHALGGQWGIRPRDPVVLTLARVIRRKGHDHVIRAMPRILRAAPRSKYLICGLGSESYLAELRRLVGNLGLEDSVVFGGFIETERVNSVYNLCDVYVMASREIVEAGDTEGFGITYLEANACQKPVVGGRTGGVPDAIVDGQTGYLVDPTDTVEIADKVGLLLGDPELAARLGRQGRDRVLRAYTWSSVSERLYHGLFS